MSTHKAIQDPRNYDAVDYQNFERRLLASDTPKELLEDICMTLAHLPTAEAQALLAKFKESPRADEVNWLQCAIDEGQDHYLSPCNDEEERDFLALKIVQEMEDRIIELEIEYDKVDLRWRKDQIKLEAVKALQAEGELDEYATAGYDNEMPCQEREMEELREQIEEMEKIMARIKQSITTERYKKVDTMTMRHYHFDGEEW
jgi:uncharacterized coiled-coil protein SlyX